MCFSRFSVQVETNKNGQSKLRKKNTIHRSKTNGWKLFRLSLLTNKQKNNITEKKSTRHLIPNLLVPLLFLHGKIQLSALSSRKLVRLICILVCSAFDSFHVSGNKGKRESVCKKEERRRSKEIQRNRQHEFAACCVQINGSNVLNFRVFLYYLNFAISTFR